MQRAEGIHATHLLLDIQELLLQSHNETDRGELAKHGWSQMQRAEAEARDKAGCSCLGLPNRSRAYFKVGSGCRSPTTNAGRRDPRLSCSAFGCRSEEH